MIEITDKTKCCGCGACVQRCPKDCISMKTDNEGFWYPSVELKSCIDCGLCEKVCPYLNIENEKTPTKVYAAKAKDESIRSNSSSGGVFSLLAKCIISQNGFVYGAAFNREWQVDMICVSEISELHKLRGSKYVHADSKRTYIEVEAHLKEGHPVLYSGTPCQIKALKLFLRKDYEQLYTVDVACHGVPSPEVWHRYLTEEAGTAQRAVVGGSTEFHSLNAMSSIKDIKFREKSYGWRKYRIVLNIAEPFGDGNNSSELSSIHYENPYFNAFNYSLIIRPSCTNCPAKHGKSNSDLTIADYWGIENVDKDIDDNKGVSLVLVNTEKGRSLFDAIDTINTISTYEDALKYNAGLRGNTVYHPKREQFFRHYKNKKSIVNYMESLMKVSFYRRLLGFIKRKLKI